MKIKSMIALAAVLLAVSTGCKKDDTGPTKPVPTHDPFDPRPPLGTADLVKH